MKIFINYEFMNWNEYINAERTNKYIANNIKQKDAKIVKLSTIGKKYTGNYPIEIIFKPHFKDKRKDLDNTRIKGLVDGLVKNGVIKNDNLNCIQRIILEPVFDNETGIEIEIKELCSTKD